MQYSVPQFIDVEDKIVGPLTGKQTIYLMIGGVTLIISFTVLNFLFFLIIFVLVAPTTLAFAFWKPKGTTLSSLIVNFFDYQMNSRVHVWRREPDMTMYKVIQKKQSVGEEQEEVVSHHRIRELANLLDTSSSFNNMYEADFRPDENIFGR